MNEEKLVSLFGNMLEEKLDKKLNTILDKRFEEFHIKLSKEISEELKVFADTINQKFKTIENTLNEHSKMLNTLIVASKTNELKHQAYDSEIGIINTKLYKHEAILEHLESKNLEKVAN